MKRYLFTGKVFTPRYFLLSLFICILYVISGRLGLQLAFVNASTTAVWAPTGIALSVLLLFGYRFFPAIFVGAFITNILTAGTVATSLGIATGNTLEAVVGTYLAIRFCDGKNAFERAKNVFKFALFVGIISTIVSATIGVVTISLGGLSQWKDFISVWITWWLGDIGGNLIVAPFVLLWFQFRNFSLKLDDILDTIFFFVVTIFVAEVVFSGIAPYPYLCIPVLVWGAFRFSQKEEATAIILLAAVSIWNTIHGGGPYAQHPVEINRSLLLLQMFLGTCSVTGMTLTAALFERRQVRRQLQRSEFRFRALIEKSFDAVVLIDPTSKILYASPSVERLLGYTPDELHGINGFDLIIPEDRKKTMKELANLVLKPGGSVTVEYRSIRKDKKIIWVEATGANMLFEPNIHAVVVNFRDITEKRKAEEEIKRGKSEDEAILSGIGEGLIATDPKGIITIVNNAALKMLRCEEKDLIGKDIVKVIEMEDENGKKLTLAQRPMTQVISSGKMGVTSTENYYVRFDKTKFPVAFTLTPIIIDKELIGTVEVFRDVTEEKEIDRAKTEFVSLASHQLRTPLTTINWYSERLIGKKLGEISREQKKYLEEIYAAGRRMNNLINALLNVSRLELGTFSVEPEKVNIPDLAKQIIKEFIFQVSEKKIVIKENYEKGFPLINADAKLVGMILQNLLSNAIKYTPEKGTVTVAISKDTRFAKIMVNDTGYGIPQHQQGKIFTKLFRADNIQTIDTDGTGLGLYLVKLLLDKIGGSVSFASEQNKGTTFTVLLPLTGMKKKEGTKPLQ